MKDSEGFEIRSMQLVGFIRFRMMNTPQHASPACLPKAD
jgi:hypothetical protein